jgi:SAM-dependent methyltransferase
MDVAEKQIDHVPPFKLFDGISDEVWRWLHLEGREQCPFLQRYLPGLTGDPKFETTFVGSSGNQALAQGFDIYSCFKTRFERYAGPLTPDSRVLDFGCGFGRVIRFFSREVAPENLIGIDNDRRAVRASANNRWCRVQLSETFPPTDLEGGSFDLIYAFSVFSHLPEEAHLAWLSEFKRLLKPDGVLVLTTFHRAFLAKDPDLAERFAPLEEALAAYDRGEFCFRPQRTPPTPYFGDAFIPEAYVRERWPFEVREFFQAGGWGQNVMVCQLPARSPS